MPSATYTLFRNAILAEQQLTCTYDGRHRELCPHIIGTNRSGEETVLAWQFAGDSRLPQWRCLRLANVQKFGCVTAASTLAVLTRPRSNV